MHANYVTNRSTSVSWHFTVDDSVIYQHLPIDENGWHAGDGTNGTGNRNSIGIEICENADADFEKATANAQWLIRKLMKENNIPLKHVVPHKKWSGKDCPGKLLEHWSSFINRISFSDTPPKEFILPAAVKRFQLMNGLTADGIYGPKTKAKLKSKLK